MKLSTKLGAVAGTAFAFVAVAALVTPLGSIDLTGYRHERHDVGAATLAVDTTTNSAGVVSQCMLVVFDKKGVEKGRLPFPQGVGAEEVELEYFEKSWAVVTAHGPTDIFYSVKVGTSLTILGSAPETDVRFWFAGKGGIVTYNYLTLQSQLFSQTFEPIGQPVVVIGQPKEMNGGMFFYCEAGGQVQVWKVKKGLELIIHDTGTWTMINEAKRLCCITDGTNNKLYSYK